MLTASSSNQVTQLLLDWSKGDKQALDQLMPLVEAELKRLARSYMRRERSDNTLQPTALVNEAYIRLVDQRDARWQNRAQFFGVAAQLMRRILIDRARKKNAVKGGGEGIKIPLDEAVVGGGEEPNDDLLALDDAMLKLAKIDPQQSKVVELRFFAGLSVEETAEYLKISPATVKRDWSMAKAWLYREIKREI
ncbi:MAG TPA: sigma-70 family RNA polymerase sigma factor [Blastocatellia bacterium]